VIVRDTLLPGTPSLRALDSIVRASIGTEPALQPF
jgi:hypothetical protein